MITRFVPVAVVLVSGYLVGRMFVGGQTWNGLAALALTVGMALVAAAIFTDAGKAKAKPRRRPPGTS